ncbi:response regulator [Cupriavidus basilensis]
MDVLVLDISMPGRSGLDLIPSIRSEKPLLPVDRAEHVPTEQYAVRAFEAGASGVCHQGYGRRWNLWLLSVKLYKAGAISHPRVAEGHG